MVNKNKKNNLSNSLVFGRMAADKNGCCHFTMAIFARNTNPWNAKARAQREARKLGRSLQSAFATFRFLLRPPNVQVVHFDLGLRSDTVSPKPIQFSVRQKKLIRDNFLPRLIGNIYQEVFQLPRRCSSVGRASERSKSGATLLTWVRITPRHQS